MTEIGGDPRAAAFFMPQRRAHALIMWSKVS